MKAYLIAYPAGHSVSPAMHNAAFVQLQLAAEYQLAETPPHALAEVMHHFRHEPKFLGANVTIPHKQAVMPLLDGSSQEAKTIGAVNTIVKNSDGSLYGHNTDATGYKIALQEKLEQTNLSLAGKNALILGAGGAARAVLYALIQLQPVLKLAKIAIYNRTQEKAEALARAFPKKQIIAIKNNHLAETSRNACLIINTTSVGMTLHKDNNPKNNKDTATPLPYKFLPPQGLVSDIVYRPLQTPLLKAAQARGLAVQNGLPMLVYQGAAAFKLWTGKMPPSDVMMEAALKALRQ